MGRPRRSGRRSLPQPIYIVRAQIWVVTSVPTKAVTGCCGIRARPVPGFYLLQDAGNYPISAPLPPRVSPRTGSRPFMTDYQTRRPISSTYRLQFHKGFPFREGERLADYLSDLGVSHVYSSPILKARAGSLHGYDVVDYGQINPELGGEEGFRSMAVALAARNIGLILDIVPNHVAVGGDDNKMWLDLLKSGSASRYAHWFDIDFACHDEFVRGKIHAPFLGEPLRRAIAEKKLTVVSDPPRGGFALRYGEHLFPLRVEDDAAIYAEGPLAFKEPDSMRELAERQHYRLDYWRNASDRLNWRRFFEVTQLAGIRMENADAFEAAHKIAFALYADGLIDGMRIDHIDGLADPAAYCMKLRRRLSELGCGRPPAWLLVEKILAPGETLPAEWQVDGTTGYDFMDQVSGLQHNPSAETMLSQHWSRVSGRSPAFVDEEHTARREVLEKSFEGQREVLVTKLLAVAGNTGNAEDLTRGGVRRAIVALLGNMKAYRTYATGSASPEFAGPYFDEAHRLALEEPLADELALNFIAAIIQGTIAAQDPTRAEIIRRFNQLSSPLAARAVEDTTFYRYGRLLSRNDVGFDAASLSMEPARFHGLMAQRTATMPRSMLTLATHDHKRGADVRARLAVISQCPEEWRSATQLWFALNSDIRPSGLNAADEYCLYQMLVGTWPLQAETSSIEDEYAERIFAWWIKALREAKLRSNWTAPNTAYEGKAEAFVRSVFDRGKSIPFLQALQVFVDRVAAAGALNGLTQVILQCTAPGIPDTYQGTERWDFSGVDPDNRRPVDYELRAFEKPSTSWQSAAASWRDGKIKQRILQELLGLRRRMPELFLEGDYVPLKTTGARKDEVIAYSRVTSKARLAVIVPIRSLGAVEAGSLGVTPGWWGDTAVALPEASGFTDVFTNQEHAGTLSIALAFGSLPFWTGVAGV